MEKVYYLWHDGEPRPISELHEALENAMKEKPTHYLINGDQIEFLQKTEDDNKRQILDEIKRKYKELEQLHRDLFKD